MLVLCLHVWLGEPRIGILGGSTLVTYVLARVPHCRLVGRPVAAVLELDTNALALATNFNAARQSEGTFHLCLIID